MRLHWEHRVLVTGQPAKAQLRFLEVISLESALRFVGDCPYSGPSQVVLVIKNLPVNAGDAGVKDSIPGSGRSPGGGHGNPLQYSSLENLTDRGAWWDTVHRVAKSQVLLKLLHSMHAQV